MTAVADRKKLLRKEALRRRRSIPDGLRREKSRLIAERLLSDERLLSAGTVQGFFSMRDEVAMEEILRRLLELGKRVALPLVTGPGKMEAVELKSFADLAPGDFNIPTVREAAREIISPEELDCVIVPAVAFSEDGYRLGMGEASTTAIWQGPIMLSGWRRSLTARFFPGRTFPGRSTISRWMPFLRRTIH